MLFLKVKNTYKVFIIIECPLMFFRINFKTFFLKEVSTGFKRPMIYIFLFIFTAIATIGVVNSDITFGGATGNIFKNAPHVMTLYITNLSIIGLLIATTYFNNAALRDYQNNFDGILFSTSINKAGYFFGRVGAGEFPRRADGRRRLPGRGARGPRALAARLGAHLGARSGPTSLARSGVCSYPVRPFFRWRDSANSIVRAAPTRACA